MAQSVDPQWAKQVLDWWVQQADAALMDGRTRREHEFCQSGPRTDVMLERELQTRRVIKVILRLDSVGALVRPLGRHNFVELQTGLDLARRALGQLATAAESAQYITGTSAPTMAADSLHPLVWDAASKLWHDEHHGAAVQRAATFLNAHVQDLTGRRDVSDSTLMAQVFSANPPEQDKPRLRWPGDDKDLTVKAMRAGCCSSVRAASWRFGTRRLTVRATQRLRSRSSNWRSSARWHVGSTSASLPKPRLRRADHMDYW